MLMMLAPSWGLTDAHDAGPFGVWGVWWGKRIPAHAHDPLAVRACGGCRGVVGETDSR